ncbi:MAG: hypothetical protein O0X96_04195 [Methanocorpusculum sp.]|nr:hypothetical protein [Methanocorpusculum sp.]
MNRLKRRRKNNTDITAGVPAHFFLFPEIFAESDVLFIIYKYIERELGFVRHIQRIRKITGKHAGTLNKWETDNKYEWMRGIARRHFGIPKPNFGSNVL